MSSTPSVTQRYAGECRRCDRTVSRPFDSIAGKTVSPGKRVRCAKCRKTVWCEPVKE